MAYGLLQNQMNVMASEYQVCLLTAYSTLVNDLPHDVVIMNVNSGGCTKHSSKNSYELEARDE